MHLPGGSPAARHGTQFYDQLLAPSGLRTTQFSLLAKLRRDGITRIEPAANDRRSKEVHLTKRGLKQLEAAWRGWIEAQAQFETAFGSARTCELRVLLRELVVIDLAGGGEPLRVSKDNKFVKTSRP